MSSFEWGPAQDDLEDLAEQLDEVLSTRFGGGLRSIRCHWEDERIVLGWDGPVPPEAEAVAAAHTTGAQVVQFGRPDLHRDHVTRWRTLQDVTAALTASGFDVTRAWRSDDRGFVDVELETASLQRRVGAHRIAASVQGTTSRIRLHWRGTPGETEQRGGADHAPRRPHHLVRLP